MSEAFRTYYETKDILEDNLPEDNLKIFVSIIEALVTDIHGSLIGRTYTYESYNEETQELEQQEQSSKEIIDEILVVFKALLNQNIFANLLSSLIPHLQSINQPIATLIIDIISEHLYESPLDTDLMFQMDEELLESAENLDTPAHSTLGILHPSANTTETLSSSHNATDHRNIFCDIQRARAYSNAEIYNGKMSFSFGKFSGSLPNWFYKGNGDGDSTI